MNKHEQDFIQNNYPKYKSPQAENIPVLKQKIEIQLAIDLQQFLKYTDPQKPLSIASIDRKTEYSYEMYDGAGGDLFTLIKLYELFNKYQFQQNQSQSTEVKLLNQYDKNFFLQRALTLFENLEKLIKQEKNLHRKRPMISFCFSPVGVYMCGCKLFYYTKNVEKFNECISNLLQYQKLILRNYYDQQLLSEILYGLSGYLYCLLELQKYFQYNTNIEENYRLNLETQVQEICELIIDKGTDGFLEQELPENQFRLYYEFHKSEYLGPAHGLLGICYMLLKAYEINEAYFVKLYPSFTQQMLKKVKQSLDFSAQFQDQQGGFGSRLKKSSRFPSYQWCHGAPGAIPCFMQAYKVFQDQKYLQICTLGGNATWNYGILKKGFGLCHGISGNGYSFLSIYKQTQDEQWLYNAYLFALIKMDKNIMNIIQNYEHGGRYVKGMSDSPLSLLLGLSGDICFYIDCLLPKQSTFPGHEI